MGKTFITDSLTGSRIPFLRGILIRSLQDSGLAFDKAYDISTLARDGLIHKTEFQSIELREMVLDLLAKGGFFDIIARYSDRSLPAEPITIIEHDGTRSGFSTSDNRRFLESCGLTPDESMLVIGKLKDSLAQENRRELPVALLGYRIYQILKNEFGPPYDQNYLVWKKFQQSGKPLLLLIGGATGCGKSSIATEIAHNLNIHRIQSTDMLREVMRIMIPTGLLPILHTSSFNAWQTLPRVRSSAGPPSDSLLIDGYSMQAKLLATSCEAVINRALKERVSLILEGIHVEPTLLQKIPSKADAAVVMIMLAVLKQEQLKKQIRGRGDRVPIRRAKRYLKHFQEIWSIQSNLLAEADRCQVPIVINDNKELVIGKIMKIIVATLRKDFNATAEELFVIPKGEVS
jgi:2-phosphoglycerate kinase